MYTLIVQTFDVLHPSILSGYLNLQELMLSEHFILESFSRLKQLDQVGGGRLLNVLDCMRRVAMSSQVDQVENA